MRTYWTAYRLAERHEVHVVTNAKEATPPFRMHMRSEDWTRCEAQFEDGSLTVHWSDPVDRSQSYLPMASPFVSKLAGIALKIHAERPFDVVYSHYLEPYGVAGHLVSEITGIPHVVRMAGSDAGRLWHHPQLEVLYDHVLRSAAIVIAGGTVKQRAIERGVASARITFGGGYALPETSFTPNGRAIDIRSLRNELEPSDELTNLFWGEFVGDTKYFGIYGKLGETKGSFSILRAMHQLKLEGLDIGLVALAHGTSEVEDRFRQLAQQLDLIDRILQIPYIPHWRVPDFLRSCLAVCCLEQNFPIRIHTPVVAKEVLLCGSCLVISKELLRKLPDSEKLPSGYGCVAIDNVHDVGALASRLAGIANDPVAAAAVGARGYHFARELEHDVDFPHRLNEILTGAAKRMPLVNRLAVSGACDIDPSFQLTRLCVSACPEISVKITSSTTIDLPKARAILAATKRSADGGLGHLRSLIPAIEIEVAVAEVENSVGDRGYDEEFVRLDVKRWALGPDDIGRLFAIRYPNLQIIKFDFDVAPYLAARTLDDFPVVPTEKPSYIIAFQAHKRKEREPLLVDHGTARVLEISEGELTCLQIARQLNRENGTIVTDGLAWLESLFRHGLIGLRDTCLQTSARPA